MSEMKKYLLNYIQVRDGRCMADKDKGDAATFDAKWARVKEEILEWRAGGLIGKETKGTHEKRPDRSYV